MPRRDADLDAARSLDDAGFPPEAIGYVNAHGTATDHGDAAESRATSEAIGTRTPISTLKSYMGHTLGACGALGGLDDHRDDAHRLVCAPMWISKMTGPGPCAARLHHRVGAPSRMRIRDDQQLRLRRHQYVTDSQEDLASDAFL